MYVVTFNVKYASISPFLLLGAFTKNCFSILLNAFLTSLEMNSVDLSDNHVYLRVLIALSSL